jgi:undecaprenyl-diphosphatase
MNSAAFDAINDLAGHGVVADDLAKWAAQYLLYAIVFVVACMWFVGRSRAERGANRRLVLEGVFSALIGLVAVALIQHFYHHPRPFVERTDVDLLFPHSADPSFPSEHVIVAAALAGSFIWNRRWLGSLLMLAAGALGFARVLAGIHYPADIIAALALGVIISGLVTQMGAPLDRVQRLATGFMPPPLR